MVDPTAAPATPEPAAGPPKAETAASLRPLAKGEVRPESVTGRAMALARKHGGHIDVPMMKAAGLRYGNNKKWEHKGGNEARVLAQLAGAGHLVRVGKGQYEVPDKSLKSKSLSVVMTKAIELARKNSGRINVAMAVSAGLHYGSKSGPSGASILLSAVCRKGYLTRVGVGQYQLPAPSAKTAIPIPQKAPPPPFFLKPRTKPVVQQKEKLVAKKTCIRCGHEHELSFFPKSVHSKTGRLKICSTCFGAAISKGTASRREPTDVALMENGVEGKVTLANRALRAANGAPHKPGNAQGFVAAVARRLILALAERGIELESVKVTNGQIKTVYRIEEETDL